MKKRPFCVLVLATVLVILYCSKGYVNSVLGLGATSTAVASAKESSEIVTVRPSAETMSRQQLPYFIGVFEATAGTKGISLYYSTFAITNGKIFAFQKRILDSFRGANL